MGGGGGVIHSGSISAPADMCVDPIDSYKHLSWRSGSLELFGSEIRQSQFADGVTGIMDQPYNK